MKKLTSAILIVLILTCMVFALDHDDPRGKCIAPDINIVIQQK